MVSLERENSVWTSLIVRAVSSGNFSMVHITSSGCNIFTPPYLVIEQNTKKINTNTLSKSFGMITELESQETSAIEL